MTISPPPKVKSHRLGPFEVLASGVDTLVLAIDICWQNEAFFDYLARMKELAIQEDKACAIILKTRDQQEELWVCTILPYGRKGYEWVIVGNDYSLKIGNWLEPKSRPSIMAEIRSETLWHRGPQEAVEFLLYILTEQGADIQYVKPSRVDLCVDITFPNDLWTMDLTNYSVTRACKKDPHMFNDIFTGLSIGKGSISARLYDKPFEIEKKSKKFWMLDVWGIDSFPKHLKIIRVEAQFRREGLKQLGFDSTTHLFEHIENLWAHFSQKWLKFQDNPGKHHTQRKTFDWYKVIQDGFLGVQGAKPLIRCKSLSTKQKQLFAQAYGLLTCLTAIDCEIKGKKIDQEVTIDDSIKIYKKLAKMLGKSEFEFSTDVLDKCGKYNKARDKMLAVHQERMKEGFPCNLNLDFILDKKDKDNKRKNILGQKKE
jgi:hypothetical protein